MRRVVAGAVSLIVVLGSVVVVPSAYAGSAAGTVARPLFPRPMTRALSASTRLSPAGARVGSRASSAPAAASPSPTPTATLPAVVPAAASEGWTATSHWRRLADGRVAADLYNAPAFRKTAGGWLPVGLGLTPALGGGSAAAPTFIKPVTFGSGTLLSVGLDGGVVALSAPGLSLGRPVVSGSRVDYGQVFPSASLGYRLTPIGIKELITLAGSSAPTEFRFHLADPLGALGGLKPDGHGGYLAGRKTAEGLSVRLPAPYAYGAGHLTNGPVDHRTAYLRAVPSGDGVDLIVGVNRDWLGQQSFPVVLDPSIVFTAGTSGANFAGFSGEDPSCPAGSSTANGGCTIGSTGGDLDLGTYVDSRITIRQQRAYLRFDTGVIPTGSRVSTATYSGYVTGCTGVPAGAPPTSGTYLCNQHNYVVDLHNITQNWDPSYNTYDDLSAITSGSPFTTFSQPAFNTQVKCANSSCFWENYPVTSQVQGWVEGSIPNYGFVAMLQGETSNVGGPSWYLDYDYYGGVYPRPQLQVTYTPAPGAPSNVQVQPGDSSAQVSWNAADPAGGTAVSKYTVQPYDDQSQQPVGNPVTVCGSCLSATLNGLTNDTSYDVRVSATNADGLTGAAATSGPFTPGYVPAVSKTSSLGQVPTTDFSRGQVVSYTIRVDNPSYVNDMYLTSISDALPAGLNPKGSPVSVDGRICLPGQCDFTGNVLTIGGNDILPGGALTVVYEAVAVGSDRTCSSLSNAATVTDAYGSSTATAPITVCDSGLGLEPWWSYVTTAVGPQASARVNAGNGNLVVQHTDSTPTQAHGHLAYVIRRTYNSEQSTLATLPGSLGAGWQLNVGQSDDLAGLGVTTTGLSVPTAAAVLDPLAVTFIDRDGTRHVFTSRALALPIDVTALQQKAAQAGRASVGALGSVLPKTLTLGAGYTNLCIDQTYDAPAGVHLGLWRYIEVAGNCASPTTASPPHIVGFAAVRPDRLRYEYSADGRVTDMSDQAGIDLRYTYTLNSVLASPLSGLAAIYEPAGCPAAASSGLSGTVPPGCRAVRFSYPTSTEVDMTDVAGRVTIYRLDGAAPASHLTGVSNPDGTTVAYTYGGCGGSADQLCTLSDPNGGITRFGYGAPPPIGPARISAWTDRRGTTTAFSYSNSPNSMTADTGAHRRLYTGIDGIGRVAELDEGDTSNNFLHRTLFRWDTASAPCRNPDNTVDNNLCHLIRNSLTAATPDEDTATTYNAEGQLLITHRLASPTNIDTTNGYTAQYIEADNTVRSFADTLSGAGNVNSAGAPTRTDPNTLFAVSDRTQSLTARGNAAGGSYSPYLTTYKTDSNPNAAAGAAPTANPCLNAGTPTGNTGLLCETDAPSYDAAHPTVSKDTYNTNGEKLTMTTPNGGLYTYSYFADSDLDLSAGTSAGGWLRAVTDPDQHFVAFGYDRAGNVVRSWDRNATAGQNPALFPGTAAVPPNTRYSETDFSASQNPFNDPWRYPNATRDPVGNITRYSLDRNGNRLRSTPPRGTAAANSSFDTVRSYDPGDLPLSILTPDEAGAGAATRYSYDAYANRTATTDPNGHVSAVGYDAVNRSTGTAFTRGPWPTDSSTVPPACRQSTGSDAPLPAGRILCSTATSYDGVDNVLSRGDANAQNTTYLYDGAHRQTRASAPRNDGTLTTLRTDIVYNPDGQPTDTCPPREFTEGTASCTGSAPFSTHTSYDTAGRVAATTTYRQHDATTSPASYDAHTTTNSYDADGNLLTATDPSSNRTSYGYDPEDRRTAMTVPRAAGSTQTTTYTYDPVGNRTAVTDPNRLITAFSYDADNRLVDTVEGADTINAALAGPAAAGGGADTRTRRLFDPDGHVVAAFDPRAFTGANSVTTPDSDYLTRTDYNLDGRQIAVYRPRFDPASALTNPPDGTAQARDCRTNIRPVALAGIPAYPVTAAVCVSRTSYDAAGNLTRRSYPTSSVSNGGYTAYDYTDDNLTATVNTPSPTGSGRALTTTGFDGARRPVTVTDPLGQRSTSSYNADGTLAQLQQPNTGATAHQTKYRYDAAGNRTQQLRVLSPAAGATPELDATDTTSFYSDNTVRDRTDGAGDSTRYLYDPTGNNISTASPSAVAQDPTNPAGAAVTNSYTADNLLAATLTPVAGSTLRRVDYSYDAGGRKTAVATTEVSSAAPTVTLPGRDGGTQRFDYSPNNRLKAEHGRDGTATITRSYDPAGNLAGINDSTGGPSTISATYYLDGLLRSVNDGTTTNTDSYDGAGQRTAQTRAPNAGGAPAATQYAINDAELVNSVTYDTATGAAVSIGYDADGRRTTRNDPNGSAQSWGYNPDGTVASATLTAGGATLAGYQYSYDALQRITAQTLTGQAAAGGGTINTGTHSYGYDNADRLTSYTPGAGVVAKTITYDHDSNRTGYGPQTFTYNADNTINSATDSTGANPKTSAYAPFGATSDDGSASYCYDPHDRLQTVAATGSAGCAVNVKTRYSYDGLDRQRTHQPATALSGAPPNSTFTVGYDDLTTTVSSDTSGNYGTQYTVDNNERTLTATGTGTDGSTQQNYLFDDGHGNITTATTETANPAVTCTARFDPWGTPIAAQGADNPCSSGSTPNQNFYGGQRRDTATGDYQLGPRTYDPAKAAFLTPDTYRTKPTDADKSIGQDPLTANRYSYVNGDPLNATDPTGHDPCNANGGGGCYHEGEGGAEAPGNGPSTAPHAPYAKILRRLDQDIKGRAAANLIGQLSHFSDHRCADLHCRLAVANFNQQHQEALGCANAADRFFQLDILGKAQQVSAESLSRGTDPNCSGIVPLPTSALRPHGPNLVSLVDRALYAAAVVDISAPELLPLTGEITLGLLAARDTLAIGAAAEAGRATEAARAAEGADAAAVDVGHAGIHQFPGITAGKSQFFDGADLVQLSNTDGLTGVVQQNGNLRYVLRDAGDIGVDRTTGLPTDIYTVIRKPDGSVLTIFPGTSPKS